MARRNQINLPKALNLFEKGYGFRTTVLNWYTIRLSHEMSDAFWDWYHTRGTLVEHRKKKDGMAFGNLRLGKTTDEEDVAILINKRIYN